MSYSTKNGRAVKTSKVKDAYAGMRLLQIQEKPRGRWRECGKAEHGPCVGSWNATTAVGVSKVFGSSFPRLKDAAIACAEAYEAEVLDKPVEATNRRAHKAYTDHLVRVSTTEKQRDEEDAEVYARDNTPPVGRIEFHETVLIRSALKQGFIAGRESAR